MKRPVVTENGLEDASWQQYCSFLKLSVEEFQAIQDELLDESLRLLASSSLGRKILRSTSPPNARDLRETVPITTYEDYEPSLGQQDDSVLSEKPQYWAFTSTSGGKGKWAPYAAMSNDVMLDYLMAAFILSAAEGPQDVRIRPGDMVMYNVAPRPFLSGYLGHGMCDKFGFRTVPPLDLAEEMDITERVEKGFPMALRTGLDVLCSLSSVLVKMGEAFTSKQASTRFSWSHMHPAILSRYASAAVRSRIENRQVLPRDLWKLKALIGWGLDTSLYRDKIQYYWGATPYEFDACTEAGVLALQSWNKKGLTPVPQTAFLEFLPEESWQPSLQDHGRQPTTVLLDGVKTGNRYEIVLTSFYGMPFIRYRTGRIVKVLSMDDPETEVKLPQVAFVGRSADVIDLAGFTRLDEKTLWQAICQTRQDCFDWVVTKEYHDSKAVLHVYAEHANGATEADVFKGLHDNLKALDPSYSNLESMLGIVPLQVTLLAGGSFRRYYEDRQRQGEDLVRARLPHINPPPQAVEQLLQCSRTIEISCKT
ncbi:MAG: GH3 auxin-responsive promoter family protein [Chloroflexi bacterium]|nr:GH3 auxin-responsive promoter family protein [Chloroflexota bacterium]